MTDIREFTSPAVFAEIQMQLHERGNASNQTEVISIQTELLENHESTASVAFSGLIREQPDTEPEKIHEIWHFSKEGYKNWVVAGIEQL
jgi:predicted lipid-binding transport protein (Tim44 family)